MKFTRFFSLLWILRVAVAHPGEVEEHDTPARREFLGLAKRAIESCQDKIAARGLARRAVERRSFLTEELRRKRGLPMMRKRDLDTVLNTDHLSDLTGLTADSPAADIFTGNLNCVLQPEVTQGPYYVEAELIRKSAVEDQEGVPLYVDIQLLDVNTCDPVTNAYMDLWHCNSTGVYSGVVANGNGDSADTTNIDATFLRALQPTDADGVAYFETIFPGHYTSRSTHMHMLVTLNATVLPNNTLDGGYVSHVGQAFFDQSLISSVEKLAPYSTNTQELTLNSADQILSEEAASMDPVVKYTLLGDSLSDGIIAWITIGINSSTQYTVSAASTWTANGGVANGNSMGGGSNGGGPGGNGTAPSAGPMPSDGVIPSGMPSKGAFPSGSGIPSDTSVISDNITPTASVSELDETVTLSTAVVTSSVEPVASSVATVPSLISSSIVTNPSRSASRFVTATSKSVQLSPSQPGKPPGQGNNVKPGQGSQGNPGGNGPQVNGGLHGGH